MRKNDRHIRDAWIWASTLIAAAVILALGGLVAQLANQGSRDVDVANFAAAGADNPYPQARQAATAVLSGRDIRTAP
jgi:hypothetical protein